MCVYIYIYIYKCVMYVCVYIYIYMYTHDVYIGLLLLPELRRGALPLLRPRHAAGAGGGQGDAPDDPNIKSHINENTTHTTNINRNTQTHAQSK